jgi:hypothetical protein
MTAWTGTITGVDAGTDRQARPRFGQTGARKGPQCDALRACRPIRAD